MSVLPANARCWITWREVKDADSEDIKKVPYDFGTDKPLNVYADRDYSTLAELPRKALRGFVLGQIDSRTAIIGLDLDTCLDAEGKLTDWARETLDVFDSYAEVSPSQTGVKAYARIRLEDLAAVKDLLGGKVRETWSIGAGKHPPGIMVASGGFFTVTDDAVDDTPLRAIDVETVRRVIKIGERIQRDANSDKDSTRDNTRSARHYREAVKNVRAGLSYEDHLDRLDDELADYAAEMRKPGQTKGERNWERAVAHVEEYRKEQANKFRDLGGDDRPIFLPLNWGEVAKVPSRQFLYGVAYTRSFVSATVAPGGMGKTSLLISEAFAMISGKPLLGEKVTAPLRVAIWNLEDDMAEMMRRVEAARLHFAADIKGTGFEKRLFLKAFDSRICIARVEHGEVVLNHKLIDRMIAGLKAAEIDVLSVDPFIASHAVPGNDNDAIGKVARDGWGRIAKEADCAVMLAHHTRKGSFGQTDFSIDDTLGAGALINAVRYGRVLNRMDRETAGKLGVAKEAAWTYVRVDSGKGNHAPPGKATWRRLQSVELKNRSNWKADDADRIGVAEEYVPPDLSKIGTDEQRLIVEAMGGRKWRESPQAADWVGHAFARALKMNPGDPQQRAAITAKVKAGISAGWLVVTKEREGRKTRPMVSANPVRRLRTVNPVRRLRTVAELVG